VFSIDVAASRLYDKTTQKYAWGKKQYGIDELLKFYVDLVESYPIYSLEDGFCEIDTEGWRLLTKEFGEDVQVVGDDLFATNAMRIKEGLSLGLANAAVIKPNQVGTVTETLQAIKLCKDHDMNVVVSHRSGETNDTFIVDLAVGSSAGQMKAGAPARGERLAKYNQLLAIEDGLMHSMME
jgi:enolase